jgi:hypothetical protein
MGAPKRRGLVTGVLLALAAWVLLTAPGPGGPVSEFLAGYRAAGGPPDLESHILNNVIPCESGWIPSRVSSAGHLGLLQFDPGTWASAGGGDWADPHTQGRNGATWLWMLEAEGSSPGSTAGWPGCWWAGAQLPATGSGGLKTPPK